MKKEYRINVDITLSAYMYVEAESEEQAKELAIAKAKREPYDIARGGCYVDLDILDIEEYEGA